MSVFLRSLEKAAARRSTALIAQAAAQAADIASFLGPRATAITRVIPPGIEVPGESSATPPARDGKMRVVFPGRLEPVKDPALALDVLALLPPAFELHVFGDGSLRDAVRRRIAAAPGMGSRVVLHPPTAARADLFAGAAATLLTSREEGTPLALLESQAFGVPVVAPDVGAVRSVVAPGGGMVVAREAKALAAAVVEVARTPASPEAARWVRERFSAARMAADVAALYEELLGTTSGA
jgi:glycosyltransferase involved in cell wall biosynthesis